MLVVSSGLAPTGRCRSCSGEEETTKETCTQSKLRMLSRIPGGNSGAILPWLFAVLIAQCSLQALPQQCPLTRSPPQLCHPGLGLPASLTCVSHPIPDLCAACRLCSRASLLCSVWVGCCWGQTGYYTSLCNAGTPQRSPHCLRLSTHTSAPMIRKTEQQNYPVERPP